MQLSEKLVQLGFTNNQALVYSALVELGQTKASGAIKKTGLHRNIVYEALEALEQQRLIYKTSKGGVALFQASDATSIVTEAQSRLDVAKTVAEEVNLRRDRSQHEVKMYEGTKGLSAQREQILQDLQGDGEEHLVIATGKAQNDLYETVFRAYDQKRVKHGIPMRILFPQQEAAVEAEVAKTEHTTTRFLPHNVKQPTMLDIWKDNVAFMMQDTEPFIVSIKSGELAQSFKEYFDALWNQDVATILGLENVQELFQRKMHKMKDGDEYAVLGASYGDKESERILLPWFYEYHRKRIQKNIQLKMLSMPDNLDNLNKEMRETGDPKMKLTEIRGLTEEFTSPMQFNIYPDSVTLFYWAAGPAAVAVDIVRKDIRDAMHNYFEALWKQARK